MIRPKPWTILLVQDLFSSLCDAFPEYVHQLRYEICGSGFAAVYFTGEAPPETKDEDFWERHKISMVKWIPVIRFAGEVEWEPYFPDKDYRDLIVADIGWLLNESVLMGGDELNRELKDFCRKMN